MQRVVPRLDHTTRAPRHDFHVQWRQDRPTGDRDPRSFVRSWYGRRARDEAFRVAADILMGCRRRPSDDQRNGLRWRRLGRWDSFGSGLVDIRVVWGDPEITVVP